MRETAETTGGIAFVNTNGLAEIAESVVHSGQDFYTLSYSPGAPHLDNRWHKVRVEVEEKGSRLSCRLSYRRGYYDDQRTQATPVDSTRKRLLADGQTAPLLQPTHPIILAARVAPSVASLAELAHPLLNVPPTPAPKAGEFTSTVHYQLPLSALQAQAVGGRQRVVVGTGILASNHLGRPVARLSRDVTLTLDQHEVEDHPDGFVSFTQQINLPAGQNYLYILVWDHSTGRTGTIHVPVDVATSRSRAEDVAPVAGKP